MNVCKFSEAAKFSKEKHVGTVVAQGAHSRTTVWALEAGQTIHPHSHDGDHLWVVMEGKGRFLTDATETLVEAGSIVFAPEGEPHGMAADTRLVFVSVSAGGEH